MKERKGFTLIELLAVIVILAIIALIAVPIVMNIITKANKSAFQDTAYGIIKAGELYYAESLLEPNGMANVEVFEFPNDIGNLQIKGSLPSKGRMVVTKEGKVAITISNGKYCVKKDYDDSNITINENMDNCILPKVTYTNGIMTSEDKCIKNSTICPNGTKINVKVNDSSAYDFYVIKDKGIELTLIMDRNIGPNVAWISKEDYTAAGGKSYGEYGNIEKGPLTLLKAVENQTTGWTNVPMYTYELKNDDYADGYYTYPSITRKNVRARVSNYTEADMLGCKGTNKSCPNYLYTNLGSPNQGYWLSTAFTFATQTAWILKSNGTIITNHGVTFNSYGVRPIIILSKNL